MSTRVWFWLFSLSALWGGTFLFTKVALAELPPFTVVFARVALAATALNVALLATRGGLLGRGLPLPAFCAMALLNNVVPFSLIAWGQTQIASGLAAILNGTTPLFTMVVAHFLTDDERITGAKVAALVAGLAGVVLLIGPDMLDRAATGTWGQVACLAASLCYAFAGLYGRRFRSLGIGSMEAATGQVTASALLILPVMAIVDRPWELAVPSAAVCAALCAAALLSTALGYVLYFRILASAGATNLLLVTFLMPAMAIVLGAAFLGERLQPRHFAGMGLIGLGLVLIDGRIARALRPAK